ncbi:MAG: methyltransferase domain-containing protein [Leptospiraceae bacterium]|nr:methyltransferase domain-containing protein [Leptospiraceae bacterium]MCP5500155.1 methyltransferase domain-containing protein [Leptospiraceae bacterium]
MDLKEEDILKDKIYTHWYYVSKGFALKHYIKDIKSECILDVGAGSGIFSRQLLETSSYSSSTCVDISYPKEWDEVYKDKPIYFKKNIETTDADLVLMMDVLEHVEDDVALLKSYVDKVQSGAYFLITVPAFQFLFSGHDLFLEHHRRYTSSMIQKTVKSAGLEVVRCHYFFGLLFPLIAGIRLFTKLKMKLLGKSFQAKSDLKLSAPFINFTLIGIHKLELLFFPINKLAGLSVFCLAKKK